ncbi:MAG: hypothetical protein ACI4QI_04920 [Candidatus Coproplasma sp.]
MKKGFAFGLLIISLLITIFCFGGCNKSCGKFFSLDEAYEQGLISVEQLQEIADYHNDGKDCPTLLDDKIANAIKETAAADLVAELKYHGNNSEIVKPDYFSILHYYGNYNSCYAVMIYNPFVDYAAVVVDEWVDVGGIQFHLTRHESIQIWVQN